MASVEEEKTLQHIDPDVPWPEQKRHDQGLPSMKNTPDFKMQPSPGEDQGSPDSNRNSREYRPGVQAIVEAVKSSRRFKGRHQSVPEENTGQETGSSYMSPETGSSGVLRKRSPRQRETASFRRRAKKVTPVERLRRLDDMRDREHLAAYNNSRLTARLEILDSFINNALTDDMFMGRQEMNPWRFRRNENLNRRWQFVHNVMVTQELIDVIQTAKERKSEDAQQTSQADVDERESPDGESVKSHVKETAIHPQPRVEDLAKDSKDEDLSGHQGFNDELTKDVPNDNAVQETAKEVSSPRIASGSSGKDTSERLAEDGEVIEVSKPASVEEKSDDILSKAEVPRRRKEYDATALPRTLTCSQSVRSRPPKSHSMQRLSRRVRSPNQLPPLKSLSNHGEGKTSAEPSTSAEDSYESRSSSTSSFSTWVIFGFGSHHRRDTCDYCGRYLCPGMRNRGLKRGDQQNGGGGRHYLNERKNDMEGIYNTSEKASKRLQKRLVKRMKQLGLE